MSPPAPPLSEPAAKPRRPKKHIAELPNVDERLVAPGTRFEILDGKVEYVPPADEPRGTSRAALSALLEAYAAPTYDVAVDMLTRTSVMEDIAPSASVFPAARDPETGGRQLEELAFEVVRTEQLAHAGKKARSLSGRGVRRVFAVDVTQRRVFEWSRRKRTWEPLAPDRAIKDRSLALPLPLAALVDPTKIDDAIARALIAKKNPVVVAAVRAAKAAAFRNAVAAGRAEALVRILAARGLRVSKKTKQRILAERDEVVLRRWLTRAVTCQRADDLFSE